MDRGKDELPLLTSIVCLEGLEITGEVGEGMEKRETREVSGTWKIMTGVSASQTFAEQTQGRTLGIT